LRSAAAAAAAVPPPQVSSLKASNDELQLQLRDVNNSKSELLMRLTDLTGRWGQTVDKNQQLQREALAAQREVLQLRQLVMQLQQELVVARGANARQQQQMQPSSVVRW
jgi:chromosome segregation ATPase